MSEHPPITVGRSVYYYEALNHPPLAATVTVVHSVHTGMVSLQVFHEFSIDPMTSVPFSPTPKPGHWSWPPRG